jgi:hypothetical protein
MARTTIQALICALLFTPSLAVAGDLTLRDVIELHRSGLGDDLLISVIDADGGPFALTFADIQDLKSDGISERVITALVRTGARPPSMGGAGAAPVVQVRQEVINYVVPAVVLLDSSGTGRSPSGTERPPSRTDRAPHASGARPDPPPATWVTSRPSVPAATWITPRHPQPKPK